MRYGDFMVMKQDSADLCRRFVDAAIDELTAQVEIWWIWQAMPQGRREAIRLRMYDQLQKLIDEGKGLESERFRYGYDNNV